MRAVVLLLWMGAVALSLSCDDTPADSPPAEPGTEEVVVISVAGYDRVCETNDDCRVVYPGNVCGCGCDPAGISASAYDQFQADVTALKAQCIEVLYCALCPEAMADCRDGLCGVSE